MDRQSSVDDAPKNAVFLLPRWPKGRRFARMAQWWNPPADGDESSPLTLEETEHFILAAEEMLIDKLRGAIAHAHRIALVDLASVVIPLPSEQRRANPTIFKRSSSLPQVL